MVTIVGWGGAEVNAISLLWLVAAASGVLARGGRVGGVARVIVVLTLFSPLITHGGVSAESVGFAVASIAMLLATGRISRETAELLERARQTPPMTRSPVCSRAAPSGPGRLASRPRTDAAPAALIAIDIDDFGAINKRFGHATGDRMLVAAAKGCARGAR